MSRLFVAATLCIGLGACSRTGLDTFLTQTQTPIDAGVDSGADARVDASTPVVAPLCLTTLTAGTLGFKVAGALTGAAIDAEGNYYVPVRTRTNGVDGVDMVSLAPCGNERWRVNVTTKSTWDDPQFVVRLVPQGDVVLEARDTFTEDRQRLYRFTYEGGVRPTFAIDNDRAGTIIGILPGQGPSFLLYTGSDTEPPDFVEFDTQGNLLGENAGFQYPEDQCAIGSGGPGVAPGTYAFCTYVGYSAASHRPIWQRDDEILDGTSMHVLPPALDADRMALFVFGISTYDLVLRSRGTGQDIVRTPLARSIQGQVDLLTGMPVISGDGTTYVYLSVHRDAPPDGQLMAIAPDGTIQWTFAAPATREEYIHFETHLVGQGGIVYLAVGSRLYAVDPEGKELWSVDTETPVNLSAPALSPFGDLAIHTDDNALLVFATDSKGLDTGPWPSPYGNSAHTNAN